ncbi:DNA polymerase III subunit gamma and tau [Trueperella pyogenes]|uniref:DNA polymerase III subunit gamma and tau n=1 Tax=Trueperella pyogenes TaxID=1661 RepID=UPI00345C77AC
MSIALYRRYRPESFQEVIGQDHVTKPLMAALDAGRTTHAYLFSGPRGCGKTTSARILARCLNCVEYPTAKPCGVCDSCKELSRNGSGSLDVVELDAASHGGVDDARELREQAGFAPVRDRFKIFIIDEAHMVTNQGFNALLKLVEEPPPHVKFIFATTEPEKVIGTIRSRTHHYPFRLVPPLDLERYLALLCAQEGVSAGKDLLSLVVRAGTGSVRDTLSVLDQIIGGSEGTRLDYDRAVALLGYTSATLLDEAVEAISARDGAALFGVVDKVVKSGHDPRRFVEDMLQRLRDLVIIALAGEEAKDVFVSVPEDQYARMLTQAGELGAERASQCADLTNEALSEMVGATAPRLQLELLCARLIIAKVGVPAQAVSDGPEAPSPEVASSLAKFRKPTTPTPQPARQPNSAPAQVAQGAVDQQKRMDQMDPRKRPMPAFPDMGAPADQTRAATPEQPTTPDRPATPDRPTTPERPTRPRPAEPELPSQAMADHANPATPPLGEDPLAQVAAQWSAIMADQSLSRVAHAQLGAARGPIKVEDGVLYIGFEQPGLANAFTARGAREVERVISSKCGINLQVAGIAGGEPPAPKADAAQGAAPVKGLPSHQVLVQAEPERPAPTAHTTSSGPEHTALEAASPEAPADREEPVIWDEPSYAPEDLTPWPNPPAEQSILGSAAQNFPMPPPAQLPADYAANGREPSDGVVVMGAQVPPVEDPYTRTAVGKWGTPPPPAPPSASAAEDPDDVTVPDEDPEWEGAAADDPDISQSTKVGLQVVLERFDAKVIEELKES